MWHMGDGWGWWMAFGWVWMLGFWVLVIWAVTALARRRPDSHDAGPPAVRHDLDAREILDRRYASGEIDEDEYERRRARLERRDNDTAAR